MTNRRQSLSRPTDKIKMPAPKQINIHSETYISAARPAESGSELKFITELGRSLLFTVHPKKAALRVSEAVRVETGAEICGVAVELEHVGLITCAHSADGEVKSGFLHKNLFRQWLEFMPPQISSVRESTQNFFLKNDTHELEYVAPLHINGAVKGALIVGFRHSNECGETRRRLIDAATQMAAMSLNLSAHYEAAINTSINQARDEQRRFTESVLDALPVSLYVIDSDYRIVTWNRHREIGNQGMARDAVIGRDVFQVLAKYPNGKLRQEFERAFKTGKIERIEQRTVNDDGSTRHWLVSKIPMTDAETGAISHVITIGEDVTARVAAVSAAGRAEKLAAVGRLAAGVVHEINNPLATISACAEALETRVTEGAFDQSAEVEDLRDYLGLIRSETFRCKSITTGLLDFSRMRAGNRFSIDIGEVLKSSARLLFHQKRGGNNVEIKLEISDDLPFVEADEGQIQQAIIALSTNAIDAMANGGTLTMRALAQETRVVIEVADTGVGIADENLSKIFEPFFTTKEVGAGTGLGLAVCYGIITEHGGRLSVRSSVGVGTTFTMFLPIKSL